MMAVLDVKRLLKTVFDPQPGESVLVMTDVPSGGRADHPEWQERRVMADEWRHAFATFEGLDVRPLLTFACTGENNSDLPKTGWSAHEKIFVRDAVTSAHIVVAMTEYSATAPLVTMAEAVGDTRVASMPGVARCMEATALSADYEKVARQADEWAGLLTHAVGADVTFDTGHRIHFDLRHRTGRADGGLLRKGGASTLINLPAGEAYIVPYEGERAGDVSTTAGVLPLIDRNELLLLEVKANRIQAVLGDGPRAVHWRTFFHEEPARANVAELGLGCNDKAVISGKIIEDEKAGLHWAYGRSDHLGGVTGPSAFSDATRVTHTDVVCARGCPVEAVRVECELPDGSRTILW